MNIWQNKFRVPLHEEPLNYLVRATATAQSSPLSCWGTKRDKDASWANGGAVFVFVFVFDAAFVVVFVAVFGGGQRETKMQVGQTAALAVLSSNQRIVFHSDIFSITCRNLSLSPRFLIDWMSDIRKLIPILRCTKHRYGNQSLFAELNCIVWKNCFWVFIQIHESYKCLGTMQMVKPFSLQRWYHSCLVKANSNAALLACVANFSSLGSGGESPPNSSPPQPRQPPPPQTPPLPLTPPPISGPVAQPHHFQVLPQSKSNLIPFHNNLWWIKLEIIHQSTWTSGWQELKVCFYHQDQNDWKVCLVLLWILPAA